MQTEETSSKLRRWAVRQLRSSVLIWRATMCAEAVPWRCHRSLIGDALLVRGIRVEEIVRPARARPHTLTPWARLRRALPSSRKSHTTTPHQASGRRPGGIEWQDISWDDAINEIAGIGQEIS
jgi:hypothetical protein